MPNSLDALLGEVKDSVVELAKAEGKQYVEAARSDAQAFLAAVKEDLEQWTKQLANGDLSPDEFASLVRGKKDLARMDLLLQEGLAKAAIERIVNGTIDILVDRLLRGV
jgi:hypothetical protein